MPGTGFHLQGIPAELNMRFLENWVSMEWGPACTPRIYRLGSAKSRRPSQASQVSQVGQVKIPCALRWRVRWNREKLTQ